MRQGACADELQVKAATDPGPYWTRRIQARTQGAVLKNMHPPRQSVLESIPYEFCFWGHLVSQVSAEIWLSSCFDCAEQPVQGGACPCVLAASTVPGRWQAKRAGVGSAKWFYKVPLMSRSPKIKLGDKVGLNRLPGLWQRQTVSETIQLPRCLPTFGRMLQLHTLFRCSLPGVWW